MIRQVGRYIGAVLVACLLAQPAAAEGLSALARLDPAGSSVSDSETGLVFDLRLSQPVPYRIRLLEAPPRLVIDFREVDFSGVTPADLAGNPHLRDLRWGPVRPGWSRLVAELDAGHSLETAVQTTDPVTGAARLMVALRAGGTPAPALAEGGGAERLLWDLPAPAEVDQPKRRQTGAGPLVVVLDPGHGGIDPGAEAGGTNEARLMLTFARELKEVLLRAGGYRVVLTRDEDVFVPLETRISVARAAGADIFLSLHADALAEGQATGSTIYTLDETASDEASARLAERHDRADLLSGVDLSGQDDMVASVLMELARTETAPRTDRFADLLKIAITEANGKMHKHPRQRAAFSVLKAADIPSVLLELGFLSSERDFARIRDKGWRADMQGAIETALARWRVEDAAEAVLLRQ